MSRTIRSKERKSLGAGHTLRADGKPCDAKYAEFNRHRITVVRSASRTRPRPRWSRACSRTTRRR